MTSMEKSPTWSTEIAWSSSPEVVAVLANLPLLVIGVLGIGLSTSLLLTGRMTKLMLFIGTVAALDFLAGIVELSNILACEGTHKRAIVPLAVMAGLLLSAAAGFRSYFLLERSAVPTGPNPSLTVIHSSSLGKLGPASKYTRPGFLALIVAIVVMEATWRIQFTIDIRSRFGIVFTASMALQLSFLVLVSSKMAYSASSVESKSGLWAAWREIFPILVASGIGLSVAIVGTAAVGFTETTPGRLLTLIQLYIYLIDTAVLEARKSNCDSSVFGGPSDQSRMAEKGSTYDGAQLSDGSERQPAGDPEKPSQTTEAVYRGPNIRRFRGAPSWVLPPAVAGPNPSRAARGRTRDPPEDKGFYVINSLDLGESVSSSYASSVRSSGSDFVAGLPSAVSSDPRRQTFGTPSQLWATSPLSNISKMPAQALNVAQPPPALASDQKSASSPSSAGSSLTAGSSSGISPPQPTIHSLAGEISGGRRNSGSVHTRPSPSGRPYSTFSPVPSIVATSASSSHPSTRKAPAPPLKISRESTRWSRHVSLSDFPAPPHLASFFLGETERGDPARSSQVTARASHALPRDPAAAVLRSSTTDFELMPPPGETALSDFPGRDSVNTLGGGSDFVGSTPQVSAPGMNVTSFIGDFAFGRLSGPTGRLSSQTANDSPSKPRFSNGTDSILIDPALQEFSLPGTPEFGTVQFVEAKATRARAVHMVFEEDTASSLSQYRSALSGNEPHSTADSAVSQVLVAPSTAESPPATAGPSREKVGLPASPQPAKRSPVRKAWHIGSRSSARLGDDSRGQEPTTPLSAPARSPGVRANPSAPLEKPRSALPIANAPPPTPRSGVAGLPKSPSATKRPAL